MSFLGNLFGHDDAQNYHQEIYSQDYQPEQHQSSWTHEVSSELTFLAPAIAAAAGFEAMKAYENHLRNQGGPVSHPVMKELLASFAAAEVDKLVETKGLDYIDRERAKRQAVEQARSLAEQKYGNGNTGWEAVQGGGAFGGGYQGSQYQSGYGGGGMGGGMGGGGYDQGMGGGMGGGYGGGGGPPGGQFMGGGGGGYDQGGYGQQGGGYGQQGGGYGGQQYGGGGQGYGGGMGGGGGGYDQGFGGPPPGEGHHHHHRREEY
ncbi:hypothetical protein YB2330_004012 [Saitoella coloradoensis]